MKKLPINIKIIIGVIVTLLFISTVGNMYTSTIRLYNGTKELQLSYKKAAQEQISNYDGYYLAFIDKQSISNINKETFIEVTNIIMSNRKDGQSVAWKWTHENQNIPYEEFTLFYKELSSFTSERYADNMKIERSKQDITQRHNLLIEMYPNNIINKFLKINQLTYKEGYISENTKSKFNN